MKIIIGLGNPGLRYKNTRHNAGFLVIKELSGLLAIPVKKKKYGGLWGNGRLDKEEITLFMPQTFMNLSGEAVREVVKKSRHAKTSDILVIYDDIDLQLGSLRLRAKGTSGGHKGIKSIIDCLDTDEFPRLRIGIGAKHKISDVVKFVLSPFNSEEKAILKKVIKEATECALAWIKEGPERAMSLFNKTPDTAKSPNQAE